MENVRKANQLQDEMISISRAEYEELQARNAELTQQVHWLMEQMRLARQKRFGSSSEKSQYDQIDLFNEAEATADKRIPEPELTEIQKHYRQKAKESKERLPADLPARSGRTLLAGR